jgi:hypothetical protein
MVLVGNVHGSEVSLISLTPVCPRCNTELQINVINPYSMDPGTNFSCVNNDCNFEEVNIGQSLNELKTYVKIVEEGKQRKLKRNE